MKFLFILTCTVLAMMTHHAVQVQSSKILAIYAFPGKSHFMMHTSIIRELIRRGHEVTMITALTLEPQNLGRNYTEILIEPVYDFWLDVQSLFNTANLFDLPKLDFYDFIKMVHVIGVKTTEHALQQPKVQALINASTAESEGRFDLLLVEQFYQEAFLAFAHKYNIPVVSSSTLDYENHMSQIMGFISPWSFVPHGFVPFTDHMTFSERLWNSIYSLYEDLAREYRYFPQMDELVQKYFSHLPVKIPSISQMEKNISIMLVNSYVPLTTPRPTTNSIIPVGGLHIYPPKQLPADIERFLDEATHGVVYFSLGSNVQSKDMPTEKLRVFLKLFGSLKQRILWKFENESIPDLPSNIMIRKWLPQSDILAHRNVRTFITHGGLFGTQEGVHHAVPMLGLPIYCDQLLNMKKAVRDGYGISLEFESITEAILKDALLELLHNPKYKENIQRVSRIFRDRPLDARDSAIYWIEHVLRHKGAAHLRSAGLSLRWYEFYLLDVIAVVAGAILLSLVLLMFTLRWLCGGNHRSAKLKLQ